MNKKLIIILVILIIIIVGIVIFLATKGNDKDSKKVEVTIKLTAGIPYKWVYEIENENIVKYVKQYTLKDENTNGKVGAPIYINYVFEGVNPGETTVTFKYISIVNEEDIIETKEFIMKVDELNNISLTQK